MNIRIGESLGCLRVKDFSKGIMFIVPRSSFESDGGYVMVGASVGGGGRGGA